MKKLFFFLAAAALLSGCSPKTETYSEKVARLRAGTDEAIRAACTNDITGLRAIINISPETSDDNYTRWTAKATVDYFNHAGGVDRTNLDYKAYVIGGEVQWVR